MTPDHLVESVTNSGTVVEVNTEPLTAGNAVSAYFRPWKRRRCEGIGFYLSRPDALAENIKTIKVFP